MRKNATGHAQKARPDMRKARPDMRTFCTDQSSPVESSLTVPAVLVVEGYRFHFFANEGPRPHIHVSKDDGTAKVWLDTLEMADWDNLTSAQRRRILRLTAHHRAKLLRSWNEFFASK